MSSHKKKLEILFKAQFPIEKANDAGIRTYLKEKIAGINIKAVEIFEGKGGSVLKALVTSNVGDILLGNTEPSEADVEAYHRGKSKSFMGALPGMAFGPEPGDFEAKDQEISDLGNKLSKANLEISKLKAQIEKASKQASEVDMKALFQEQIMALTENVEKLDTEKTKLEKINKSLTEKTERLEQQLELRKEISSSRGGKNDANSKIELLEKKIIERETQYEEERANLTEKMNEMTLRIMAEQDKTEDIKGRAELANRLEKTVASLNEAKKELEDKCDKTEDELHTTQKQLTALQAESKDQLSKISTVEQEIEKLRGEKSEIEKKLAEISDQHKILTKKSQDAETELAALKKAHEALNVKYTEATGEREALINERDKLMAEYALLKKKSTEKKDGGKESFKKEIADLQKSIKEKEETIRNLKVDIKARDETIPELKSDLKNSEKQIESLQKNLAESEKRVEEARKQLQKLEKTGKSSEKTQSSTLQKIESLEQEIKRKEKELKVKGDQLEESKKENILIKARLNAAEKNFMRKNEDPNLVKETAPSLMGTEASGSVLGSITSDEKHTDSVENVGKLSSTVVDMQIKKLQKELDIEKLNSAQANGKYFETKAELEKERSKNENCEKELIVLRVKIEKAADLAKVLDENSLLKKSMEEITKENVILKNQIQDNTDAVLQAQEMKNQHELLMKEKNELKTKLFELEEKSLNRSESAEEGEEKKVTVIQEIRDNLAEVIYVYRTLDTNAREFMAQFEEKKEKLREVGKVVAVVLSSTKKEEIISLLKQLSEEFFFMKPFQIKAENFKILFECLNAAWKKKESKAQFYIDQVDKFRSLMETAQTKWKQYENKLAYYY